MFTLIFSLLIAPALAANQISIGMSESIGVHGVASMKVTDDSVHEDFFYVFGTTFIIFGGAGAGLQHHYSDGHLSPFTTVTAFGTYILPAMCSVSPCPIRLSAMVSGSAGLELRTLRVGKLNTNLQAGVYTAYDVTRMGLFESPSDIPAIWPILNIQFAK